MVDVAMAVLTVIGTVASFYGAWLAWKQACISKLAAKSAENIKEQLINHRATSELSELLVYIEFTRRTFTKYGSGKSSSLTGVNQGGDAEVALEFAHKLKKFRDYFSASGNNVADDTSDQISDEVGRFKSASKEDISDIGFSILNKVVAFSPILQKKLTEQKERTTN